MRQPSREGEVSRLGRLRRLARSIGGADDLESALQSALDGIESLLEAERGAILLTDSAGALRFQSWRGLSPRAREALDGHWPWPAATSEPEPVVIADLAAEPELESVRAALAGELAGLAYIPLLSGPSLFGALLFGYAEPHPFSDLEIEYARLLAAHVAGAAERHQTERQAAAALDHIAQARAADERKDEFLAILGHELRNPLAPIVTALELLDLEGARFSNTRAREIIERQVRYLQRLVDDLLDVSRITRGKLELRREMVELADVVRDAIEIASPSLEKRQHQLLVDVPAAGLAVRGDRIRLAQVVANLLTNAAKYTDFEGSIALHARRRGDVAVLEVIDDGIGIPPEVAPQLFDLFVQGRHSSEAPAIQGLGLGLTIVKRLVDLHGGQVSVSSDGPGKGSRFEIRLPLRPGGEAETASAEPKAEPEPTSPDRRVLIVDDNLDAAEMLSVALRQAGYVTAVAADGPSALARAETFKPDVALVDIGLPVMDGYELAERLRASEEPPSRLIAVTGYGQSHDRERAIEAGFDVHLVKPVAVKTVLGALAD